MPICWGKLNIKKKKKKDYHSVFHVLTIFSPLCFDCTFYSASLNIFQDSLNSTALLLKLRITASLMYLVSVEYIAYYHNSHFPPTLQV